MTLLHDSYADSMARTHEVILELALPRPGARLLDVGCADGSLTVRLGERVGTEDLHGIELAPRFVEAARERGVDVTHADVVQRWPYDDGSFDVVHSNQVIEHLARTDFFLSEMRRVLRPDGYAIVATNNASSWHNIAALAVGWQPLPQHVSDAHLVGNPLLLPEGGAYSEDSHRHLRLFTHRAMAELAAAHGLAMDANRGAGWYPLRGRAAALAARLDRRHAAYLIQRYRPVAVPAGANA